MTYAEARKIALCWLADKADCVVDRAMYRVGRRYLHMHSLYDDVPDDHIDLVDWATERNAAYEAMRAKYAEIEEAYK